MSGLVMVVVLAHHGVLCAIGKSRTPKITGVEISCILIGITVPNAVQRWTERVMANECTIDHW